MPTQKICDVNLCNYVCGDERSEPIHASIVIIKLCLKVDDKSSNGKNVRTRTQRDRQTDRQTDRHTEVIPKPRLALRGGRANYNTTFGQ